MLKKLINKIWRSEGQENINTPQNQNAEFILLYHNLLIGKLSLEKGIWKFIYSEEFRNQDEIKPLINFPDVTQQYQSNELWPFFSYRIPGLNQPQIREIIKNEHINKNNEIDLLKKFGRFSISNPFELEPA